MIGKSGVEVDALRREVHAMTQKNVHININEIKRPELDAKLVAQSIAVAPEVSSGAHEALALLGDASGPHGRKIKCAGRLAGGEMSGGESHSEGRVPLQTYRADIDYGAGEAKKTFGRIGVKVWINKGEIMPEGHEGFSQRDYGSVTRTRPVGAAAPPKVFPPPARVAAAVRPTARDSGPCVGVAAAAGREPGGGRGGRGRRGGGRRPARKPSGTAAHRRGRQFDRGSRSDRDRAAGRDPGDAGA